MIRAFPILGVLAAIGIYGTKTVGNSITFATARIRAAQCEDVELRLSALNALQQMESEQAMPILKKVLERRDDCSQKLRRKAVFLVSQHHTDETEGLLLSVARNDPEMEVRRQAVFWLSQIPGDAAVSALDSILMNAEEGQLQERAIFALSQHGSSRAHGILRNYVERVDAPDKLKEKAIFWLGNEGTIQDQTYLRELYGRLTSQRLKEKVIFGISQHSTSKSRNWLLARARDESESIELRKKALFWVAQQNDFKIGELTGLYESAGERELKTQVLFALSQRNETAAIDELMEIARNEADRELRKKAIFWIGQSTDPKAAEFLMELINR